MKTKQERQEAFMKEFQELLDKHGAEFEIIDNDGPYVTSTTVANISMAGQWNEDNDCTAEYADFDLPTWMNPK